MKKILAGLMAVLLAAPLFVFFAIFGTLMGAVGGWVVGLFFADTILTFFSYIFGNSHGLQMWEIGASLGFISGYFKSAVSLKV